MLSLRRLMIMLTSLCVLLLPIQVLAHASLTEATPASDSHWATPPTQIELKFNERLEKQLFYIKVLDSQGDSITTDKAIMSINQREISVDLPNLDNDIYTVTYKVVSADGHPIEGSYVITVGESNVNDEQAVGSPIISQQEVLSSSSDFNQILMYIMRFLYYLSLLCVIGWTFWRLMSQSISEPIRQIRIFWSNTLIRLHLLTLLAMIGLQIPNLIDEWTRTSILALLGTSIGVSWVCSLALSIIGIYSLNRSKVFDAIWIVLLLLAKSMSGHALAFKPLILTIMFNWIHLLASSVWIGGLLYLVIVWRRDKEYAIAFLPKYSKAALVSVLSLVVTGMASAYIFLPRPKYVLYTQWGILLLVKTALVLLVIIVGSLIRWQSNKKKRPTSMILVRIDVVLMLMIVGIVGIFTYTNPLPANEPLRWHVMGETIHMTTNISPNAPGTNDFEVFIWLPDDQGEPEYVQLQLKYLDDNDIAPIDVPLNVTTKEDPMYAFSGFNRYSYEVSGSYLPIPGDWEIEVRVMDAEDNEKVYTRKMKIY